MLRVTLENGQVVRVKPLSPERKKARAEAAEARRLLAEYRKTWPGTAEWFREQFASMSKPIMPRTMESEAALPEGWKLTSRDELEAKGVELYDIELQKPPWMDRRPESSEACQRIRQMEKALRHIGDGRPNLAYVAKNIDWLCRGRRIVTQDYEDEIRRMMGLWVSELEPTILYGPCSIPWGLAPADHVIIGLPLEPTICSIYYPYPDRKRDA